MSRLFPSWTELSIFATLAIVCAAFVVKMADTTRDLGMSMMAIPIFVTAACFGLRKNLQHNAVITQAVTIAEATATPSEAAKA